MCDELTEFLLAVFLAKVILDAIKKGDLHDETITVHTHPGDTCSE